MTRKEAKEILEIFKQSVPDTSATDSERQIICDALDTAIQSLKQEPCDDCVKRQAVKEWLNKWDGYIDEDIIARMQYRVIDIPNALQEQNTGHWIQTSDFFINREGQFIYEFICPECNALSYFRKSNKKAIGANVCPNCGCRMSEVSE